MLTERLRNSISDYPDFPKEGIIFKDISPILADPELFSDLIEKIAGYPFKELGNNCIGEGFLWKSVANIIKTIDTCKKK